MRFYKYNAYPEIFLHDCVFRLKHEDGDLIFSFDAGFCMQGNIDDLVKGCIRIKGLPLEEVEIHGYCGFRILGRYFEIRKRIGFSDLMEYMKSYSLEVVDEFYSDGALLYGCRGYEYQKRGKYSWIEIRIYHGERPVSYYIADSAKGADDVC